MFKINPNNPATLKMVGSPVCSGGEFPVSIAVSPAKNMVCVLNGGAKNGVS
jgi:DNA-binding beta-propeller fold protein YncE